MKKIVSAMLMLSMMAGAFSACTSNTANTKNDETPVPTYKSPVSVDIKALNGDETDDYRRAYLNTSFDLLRLQLGSDQNVMISPASIMIALSMAEAGANGDTRTQMAGLWGGENDPDGQLSYAAELLERLNSAEGVSLSAADSMWINREMLEGSINDSYIDVVRDYYDSEVNYRTFDAAAVEEINDWVYDKTDGMIDKILDDFDSDAAMVLLNAIAFDGLWQDQYNEYQVNEDGTFHNADGSTSDCTLLHGEEYYYLENGEATGFIKYYEGGQYAFVAILPKDESMSADEFLAGFTGDDFDALIGSQTTEYDVYATIPEFEYDWGTSISDTLKELGMVDAFSGQNADFNGIADFSDDDRNLYIGDVIHKTHIELTAAGTRAAAVTAVMLDCAGVAMDPPEVRNVVCDRPFAYAIVDMTDATPVFIGTVNEV